MASVTIFKTPWERAFRKVTAHLELALRTTNFIDNEFVASEAVEWFDLHDPATNNLVTKPPFRGNGWKIAVARTIPETDSILRVIPLER
jgi:hypothetical protein